LRHIGLSRALGTGLAFGLLMASSRPALGQMALDWQAPEGCNERPLLEARVQELTGSSLEQQDLIGELHVVVMQVPSGWRLGMRMERDGQLLSRELEGEDCISLTHAAASAIALLLEPSDAEELEEKTAPPVTTPERRAPPRKRPQPPTWPGPLPEETLEPLGDEPAPKPGPHWQFGARIAMGADFNFFPRVTGLAGLAFFLQRGDFRLELVSNVVPAQVVDFGSPIVVYHLPIGGRVCQGATWGAVWLLPCAHYEVGYMTARRVDVSTLETARATTSALGLTLLSGYRFSKDVGLVLEVPVLLPLARHQLQGGTLVHRLPVVDVRLALGLEVRWW